MFLEAKIFWDLHPGQFQFCPGLISWKTNKGALWWQSFTNKKCLARWVVWKIVLTCPNWSTQAQARPKITENWAFLGLAWAWVDQFGHVRTIFHTTIQEKHFLFYKQCHQRAPSWLFLAIKPGKTRNWPGWRSQKVFASKIIVRSKKWF